MSNSSVSPSHTVALSGIAFIGIVLYAGFAYLVAHSKHGEVRRRWRYSIMWGVSSGAFTYLLFATLSILAFFGDEQELGYMAVLKSPNSPLDIFIGIVLFIVNPILISLPLMFLVTLGVCWKQVGMGDMSIDQLLYPVIRSPSDRSPDDGMLDRVRTFIAKLIDG